MGLLKYGSLLCNWAVRLDEEGGGMVKKNDSYVYYMFHKPAGCITAVKDDRHQTVMEYFQREDVPGLHPVGRLDKDTEGLLFVTNDGLWNQKLMNPENHVEKTYFFWALGKLSEEDHQRLEQGIELRGGRAGASRLVRGRTAVLGDIQDLASGIKPGNRKDQPVFSGYLTIFEGRKHQVKRMLKAAGCYVVYLKRVSIGGIQLDNQLAPGEFRPLRQDEFQRISMEIY